MCKLAIVIANYNNGKYLKRCVESILKTRPNFSFEVVIIDDCSTDNSREIITSLENDHDYVRGIYKEKNMTVGHTRNMAFYDIDAEYILNFDADDYFINDLLGELSKINGDWEDIIIFDYYYEFFKTNEKFRYKSLKQFQNKLEWQLLWNKIIKRSIVTENNIKFLHTNMYDDVSGLINIRFNACSFRTLNKSFVHYSYNQSSIVQEMFKEKNVKELKNNTQRQIENVIEHVVNNSNGNENVFSYAKNVYKMNVHYSYLDDGIPNINMYFSKLESMWTPYKGFTFLAIWLLFNSKIVLKSIHAFNKLKG